MMPGIKEEIFLRNKIESWSQGLSIKYLFDCVGTQNIWRNRSDVFSAFSMITGGLYTNQVFTEIFIIRYSQNIGRDIKESFGSKAFKRTAIYYTNYL